MAEDLAGWVRTAYVRTKHDQDIQTSAPLHGEYWNFLASSVRQWENRHRYIFGASSEADRTILRFMLERMDQASVWCDKREYQIHPKDCLVYIPENHTEAKIGKQIRADLESSGIPFRVVGATADECDEIMLQESDYVLDRLTCGLAHLVEDLWPCDTYRHGSGSTRAAKFDYSLVRLRDKQGSYSLNDCSGQRRPRGVSYHRCVFCGQKCKRNKPCKVTGGFQMVERPGADGMLPPNGDARWRELTSQDLMIRYQHQGPKRNWHSVDTFSDT
jgi:hypothetical protein